MNSENRNCGNCGYSGPFDAEVGKREQFCPKCGWEHGEGQRERIRRKHKLIPVPEPLFVVLAAILACAFCVVIYEDVALSVFGRVEVGTVTEYVPETSLSRKRRFSQVAHFYKVQIGEKVLRIDLKREGLQSKRIRIIYLPDDLTVASYYPGSGDVFSLVWWQFGALSIIPAVAILVSVYSIFGYLQNWRVVKKRECELAAFTGG